ncbi:ABC transporter permease [Haloferax mediterranei ATCC 33500]|uniref:ABC transporter permease n=1 Tax=Haloferax mediterranei (strain ATCC 33500 / DSM 1411 / JCM 8866 / NBRC 14739 / NCIMB 2177 / R-4) TaxID=523841 RepID=I3R0P4_HALMT|nr:ABC transporter permease [Haloferax mediterranei]AFK17804.1 oligopeptide ABC transporter permease protein [Haloferax mediterranei ATCC 33500]EMA02925.1 binding-protein-dependent transporters inner membrane component [Haloferax mediterranei ATCC 33500]MDX5987893.1 ABC transporter permease [Haloferax mediterranei ATCC 33500]QCQ74367.1 ABC transporter permease [Haloferax mediterranei ATCC 33500]
MIENQNQDSKLTDRIAANPRPALVWAAIGVVLILPEVGALVQAVGGLLSAVLGVLGQAEVAASIKAFGDQIPTLLSRDVIGNSGHYNGTTWEGNFLGLEPGIAWFIRVALVYAYSAVFIGWLINGYFRYREHYREADWTPGDDIVNRFRRHSWGKFGFVVVAIFLVMAVFAPAIGPTTVDKNIRNPYSNEITYWDEEVSSIESMAVGDANIQSSSKGSPDRNVGPMQYDDFGRFHPFGTTTDGKDLFTFVASGARVSLSIALLSIMLAAGMALLLALVTAYYKGIADLAAVLASDSVQAIPMFMLLIIVFVVFSGTWLGDLYDGAALMVGIFFVLYWPSLWRAVRGPALQVSGQEWIDAAESFGQAPLVIMKKHMAPYVIGYLLVYSSMTLGGIIIAIAGLSFIGLGIAPPTPEWGRLITDGQPYVASVSWHISLLPGLIITLVVTGFNALGDGVRDAIDPQSEGGESTEAAAAGGSGV